MSEQSARDGNRQGAHELLDHLRAHPEDRGRSPEELAREFQLSAQFVARVLSGAAHRRVRPKWTDTTKQSIRNLVEHTDELWDTAAKHPIAFVTTTTLGSELLLAAFAYIRTLNEPIEGTRALTLDGTIFLVLIGLVHLLLYFRRGMVRYPLYGGLVLWVLTAIPLMVVVFLTAKDSDGNRIFVSLLAAFAMMVLAATYSFFGLIASLAGGYVQVLEEQRKETEMTRQEMLERLFELQHKLPNARDISPLDSWEDGPLAKKLRRNLYVFAFLAGSGMQFGLSLLHQWMGFDPTHPGSNVMWLVQLLIWTYQVLFCALDGVLAVLATGIGGAMLVGLLVVFGRLVVEWLPFGGYGPLYWIQSRGWSNGMGDILLFLGIALLCGIGRAVQARAMKDAGLQSNDEATMLGEMLRLQWRLAADTCATCVLVVDAVKSSEMKIAADPLAVEYSFREYQEWVEEICKRQGGRVFSRAGDGAVVSFKDCGGAITAARKLQGNIDQFNRAVNRLESPFRLRIGLHVGQVTGDVKDVQFTEVIDIAAHVQTLSPVSGIALTDSVLEHLDPSDFVPLARQIDGHSIYLALDPVEN